MKSAWKKVVFAILLLPILVILVAFLLPARYKVERSLVIHTTNEAIFPYLNDLRRWPEWTAWNTNREPSLIYRQTGPSTGVGAVLSWTAKSGNGTIKLTGSDPQAGVSYALDFNEGRFISTGHIHLTPTNGDTRVIWTNEGDFGSNPVGRYLGLLMDKMMGADYEIGLQNLKARLERKPEP